MMLLSKDTQESLGLIGEQQILRQENIVQPNHQTVKEVSDITSRLRDVCIREGIIPSTKEFKVYVIDKNIPNAFVLPNGAIFVYTGLLPYASTEAGLAAIIGHEISHALAGHAAEKIGFVHFLMVITEFVRGLTDHERSLLGNLCEFIAFSILLKLYTLSHSRACESEADEIGIWLAAMAGYDPRHAAKVWERFMEEDTKGSLSKTTAIESGQEKSSSLKSSLKVRNRLSEVLSTHPCHERRVETLKKRGNDLVETYRKASEELFMRKNIWDNSDRQLTQKSTNPKINYILLSYDDEDVDESWRVAAEASSLMVGQQGQEWRNFLKSIKLEPGVIVNEKQHQ